MLNWPLQLRDVFEIQKIITQFIQQSHASLKINGNVRKENKALEISHSCNLDVVIKPGKYTDIYWHFALKHLKKTTFSST